MLLDFISQDSQLKLFTPASLPSPALTRAVLLAPPPKMASNTSWLAAHLCASLDTVPPLTFAAVYAAFRLPLAFAAAVILLHVVGVAASPAWWAARYLNHGIDGPPDAPRWTPVSHLRIRLGDGPTPVHLIDVTYRDVLWRWLRFAIFGPTALVVVAAGVTYGNILCPAIASLRVAYLRFYPLAVWSVKHHLTPVQKRLGLRLAPWLHWAGRILQRVEPVIHQVQQFLDPVGAWFDHHVIRPYVLLDAQLALYQAALFAATFRVSVWTLDAGRRAAGVALVQLILLALWRRSGREVMVKAYLLQTTSYFLRGRGQRVLAWVGLQGALSWAVQHVVLRALGQVTCGTVGPWPLMEVALGSLAWFARKSGLYHQTWVRRCWEQWKEVLVALWRILQNEMQLLWQWGWKKACGPQKMAVRRQELHVRGRRGGRIGRERRR